MSLLRSLIRFLPRFLRLMLSRLHSKAAKIQARRHLRCAHREALILIIGIIKRIKIDYVQDIIIWFIDVCSVGGQCRYCHKPDGRLVVEVSVNGDGAPLYSVMYDGKTFLQPSSLGMVANTGDFSRGLSMSAKSGIKNVSDSYSLPGIKKSHVDYVANEQWFTFAKDSQPVFELQLRVADNDVAFRYRMLPVRDTRSAVIKDEITGFSLPEGTVTFMAPQSKPMGGFARTSPSYETPYGVDEPIGRNGWGEGYTFPCLFKNPEGGWTLISETGVDGAYCGCRLLWDDSAGSYKVGFPQEGR